MHPFRLILMMVVSAVIAGCSSGEAFVDRNYMALSVKKQKLPGYSGQLVVCYGSDTPREVRDRLASEACQVYGLQAVLVLEHPWQCRFTVPHAADYSCVDPAMRLPNGAYVNPFSASQVQTWSESQARNRADRSGGDPGTPSTMSQ